MISLRLAFNHSASQWWASALFWFVFAVCANQASAQRKPHHDQARREALAHLGEITPEFLAALDAEKPSIEEIAPLFKDQSRATEGSAKLGEVRARIAKRLGRPLTYVELAKVSSAMQPYILRNAVADARQTMLPFLQGLKQGPPPQVVAALEGERAEIQAAAVEDPRRAIPRMREIAKRVAQRSKFQESDPRVYGWVVHAVQSARVAAMYAPGGAAYQAIPSSLRQGLDGGFAKGILDLARVKKLAEEGNVDDAVKLVRTSFSQMDGLFAPVLVTSSAAESEKLVAALDYQVDLAQVVARKAPAHAAAVETAFGTQALRKGRLLEVEQRITSGVGNSNDASTRKVRAAWAQTRARIARTAFQEAYGITLSAQQTQELATLRQLEARLQTQLAGVSKQSRSADAAFTLDTVLSSLRKALPSGDRLLSYVRYQDGADWFYGAFVLDAQQLSFSDLGRAAIIDAAVESYSEVLGQLDGSPASLASKTALAQQLYQVAFAPLESRLKGANAVHVAADGALQLAPLGGLHDGSQWLVDRYDLSYLTSERELLGAFIPTAARTSPVVVAWSPSGSPRTTSASPGPLRPDELPHLPNVSEEARAVAAKLPNGRVLNGSDATDWAVLQIAPPSILHIAAHGVLLGDTKPAANGRGISLVPPIGGASTVPDSSSFGTADGLVRSALVMSPNGSDPADGFLTAYEVATMNLTGTELVVLSACETGRGDAKRLGGVRGLRAAFFAAGAQSLVVSLWSVRDASTADLMRFFYENLAKKMGRRQALRDAMRRVRGTSPDPSNWAPFILLGKTGPITTFGAVPVVSRPIADESSKARSQRATAFRRMESGQPAVGSGEWLIAASKDVMRDSYVKGELGPRFDNLLLNVVGKDSAFSFLVRGFRGTGTYAIGRTLDVGYQSGQVDASLLNPHLGMSRPTKGTLTLKRAGSRLIGDFALDMGGQRAIGHFELPDAN